MPEYIVKLTPTGRFMWDESVGDFKMGSMAEATGFASREKDFEMIFGLAKAFLFPPRP